MSTLRRRLLDDTYKKTASGNPVIARTVARMNPGLKVYGWTEQDTYSGNNLLNFTDTEQIINGMTFHVKKSVLTVTGTTTERTSTAGEIYYMLPITVGTFYLSMRSSSMEYISNPKLEAWVIDADDTEHFYGNGAFSLNGTEKSCRVYFAIPEGNTFNGDKFYPMINVGSVPLPWEPYTGGNPAPNPDYPIPWHNAGEVMTTGAQVYDQSLAQDNLYQNYDIVHQNLEISRNPDYWISGKVPVKPNTTYSVNRTQDGGCFYSDENTPITTSVILAGRTFTTPENCNFVVVNFTKTSVSFGTLIMMNVGSVPLPWEPYTNGVPTVNPYKGEISVTIRGGNLFDISQIGNTTDITVDGDTMNLHVYANSTGIVFDGNVYRGKTLTTSRILIDGSGAIPGSIRLIDEKQDSYVLCDGGDGYKYGTLTIPDDAGDNLELYIYGSNDGEEIKATVSQLMICEGSTAFPYEPYRTPQTVLLTSDRPLTKWDRLEKRDGQWGWVFKSNVITLNGNEDERWSPYPEKFDDVNIFIYSSSADKEFGENNLVCDKLTLSDKPAWVTDKPYVFGGHGAYSYIYVNVPSSIAPDLSSFKQWISENPLRIWYETKTETFVPLTESEQVAMSTLHTNYPTTVLQNDQGCEMNLTYKTKKSLEVT